MDEQTARDYGEIGTNRKTTPKAGRPRAQDVPEPDYPEGVTVNELSGMFDYSRRPWLLLQALQRQLVVAHNIMKWTKTEANWANRENPTHIRVLDVGCGFGELYTLLRDARRVPRSKIEYTGVELHRKKVNVARILRTNIDVKEMNALDIDQLPETYNVVVSSELLEHLGKDDGKDLLRKMVDRLETDGWLILTVATPQSSRAVKRPHHLYEWPVAELLEQIAQLPLDVKDVFTILAHKRHWPEGYDEKRRLPVELVRPVASVALDDVEAAEGGTTIVVAQKVEYANLRNSSM